MLTIPTLLEKPQVARHTDIHDPSIHHIFGLLLRHIVIRKHVAMLYIRKRFSLPAAALAVSYLIAPSSAAVLRGKVSLKRTEERRNILPNLRLRSLPVKESKEKPDDDGPLPFKPPPPPPRVRQMMKKNAKRNQTKIQPYLPLYQVLLPK